MIYLLMIDSGEDRRKFVILYETYRHFMMRIALDILRDTYLAEDAVHEAFMKISVNMDKVGETGSLSTKRYLAVTAKHAAVDIYRKRKRQFDREMSVEDLDIRIEPAAYMESDADNEVLDILKNLPGRYRDVFLLKYSARMENKDIAGILDIPEGTVRQRIARGKVLIQEALDRLEEMKNE